MRKVAISNFDNYGKPKFGVCDYCDIMKDLCIWRMGSDVCPECCGDWEYGESSCLKST